MSKSNEAKVSVQQAPAGEPLSEDYSVAVGGAAVPVYSCRVSAVPLDQVWPGYQRPMDQTELAAFAYCEAAGPVSVQVTAQREIKSVVVRPLSRKITPSVKGGQISFKVSGPGQLTVEVNGWHNALHLFINPPEQAAPRADDPNVKYFGPGVHHPGKIVLESNQTIYVAAGAVVYGSISAQKASNIRILGRGIVDVSESERGKGGGAIRLRDCSDIRIDGPVLRDPDVWCCTLLGCHNAEISNVKCVGLWRYNSDGIDLCNSQDIHVHDCFVRAFDDCIVLKGLMGGGGGKSAVSFVDRPVRGILVERCVIWNDWGRALEIGAETSTPEITDVVFRDCDIIRTDYIAMDIQHGHRANVHDIRFENIRVEADDVNLRPVIQKTRDEKYVTDPKDDYRPYLMYIVIEPNSWSADPNHGVVRNVVFKDITVTSKLFLPSRFQGLDAEHDVKGVTIENVRVNGRRCNNAEEVHLEIRPHVSDVTFVGGAK
jgi:hypothetical protein